MKYHFQYGYTGTREIVIFLDEEGLQDNIWADDDGDICVYKDLTVTFDIDRYLRLMQHLKPLQEIDTQFGRVHMTADIESKSAAETCKIRGTFIEVYYKGNLYIDARWYCDWSMIDFGVYLNMPNQFYTDPAAWFEKEIAAKGIQKAKEVMEAEQCK
ncbi:MULTISPECIES: hypothetical protein [unclassified Neisseria]|uniref:hypothetical protein n=1 Tax=unclassified Neisseria TaxID=2623750 RepID=UPI002665508D|nr:MULTISPECIES: hypothetical protein [unclassified Neisseria]MDO1509513.1 hypothetical protein [Neisseria sp. MVDL19-042950]MDO1515715.1 hypothetical protein [Neisseria sp. MVDL18-041461]MDO1563461.1 hypothetical protein [Neisseria sp. MVDL20-010259]